METALPPVATKDGIRAGMHLLVTTLWHHERFYRWPTTLELSRMASWRNPDRPEGVEWLREGGLLVKEKGETGTCHRVTDEGRRTVAIPDMRPIEPTSPEEVAKLSLPEDEDECALVGWVLTFQGRNGNWPTPWNYQSCGLYQRDIDEFWRAHDRLVGQGRLVRINMWRGRSSLTRLVDIKYCPELEGKDRFMYFWSVADGPFPKRER
jgi:hypothetical protein